MEGLRNHSFIIPRPKQIIKREMPETQGKTQGIIDCIDYCRGKASGEASFSGALLILCFRPNRFSTKKNVRPGFQEKSGRHIGLQRPYVLGCFEVKQVNRGCLAAFCGIGKRRFFLFRYAQVFCDAKRWTSALRNRENRRDIPDFRRGNSAPRVICARRKGRQNPRATSAH